MIIIPNINETTKVYAPKVVKCDEINILMDVIGETNKLKRSIELVDYSDNDDYFEFHIKPIDDNLSNQEYKYELYKYLKLPGPTDVPKKYIREEYLGCGLLRIGNYKKERVYEVDSKKNDTKIDLL